MIIISGGEIIRQDNTSVTYKLKCEKCGNIDSTESKITVTIGLTDIFSKKCSNCGNNQTIKLKHMGELTK